MKLKLKKIKRIIRKDYAKEIDIIITTGLKDNGIMAFTDNKGLIILNGNNLKDENQILRGISHELIHIIFNLNDNTNEFELKLNEVYQNISKQYKEEK